MNTIKSFLKIHSLRQFLVAAILSFSLFPLTAFSACTEDVAEKLIRQNLDLRLRFLKDAEKMPVYETATAKQSLKIRQHIADQNWDAVCKGVFEIIQVADDILAGGNGQSDLLKAPWDKCTPEKMLSLAQEYDLICDPQRNIANCGKRELTPLRRELIHLKAKTGADDLNAVQYVNRTCELYTELLDIINQP